MHLNSGVHSQLLKFIKTTEVSTEIYCEDLGSQYTCSFALCIFVASTDPNTMNRIADLGAAFSFSFFQR